MSGLRSCTGLRSIRLAPFHGALLCKIYRRAIPHVNERFPRRWLLINRDRAGKVPALQSCAG